MEITAAIMFGCVAYSMAFCYVFERIYLNNITGLKQGKTLGQHIRTEAPKRHQSKEGTPTMGGIAIIITLLLSTLLMTHKDQVVFELALVTLGFGAIGFLDDYIKTVKKQNLGLLAWQKIVLQLLVAGVFAFFESQRSTQLYLPYAKHYVDLGIWAIPLMILVLLATTNAVNLTDGLDGLASGVTTVVALAFMLFCFILGHTSACLYSCYVAGACIGFLFYNHYPARVFMGDTGSLALGGAIGAIAIVSGLELALIIVGGIYVAEALSVILQVFVFKTQNGRRLFRMSPLHHHLELGGWSENMVLGVFAFISLLLAVIVLPGI